MASETPWERVGFAIGHATDDAGGTGCTVIRRVDGPFRCSAKLLGRASGTRELATTSPEHLAEFVDAVMLTGGSAYGLDAAAGVMRWMEEHGRGFPVGSGVVPIVPAAVLYDLAPVGRFNARPTPDMAYQACAEASLFTVEEGNVGAGTGALVGKGAGTANAMKSGIGMGYAENRDVVATALVAVNAFGDVRDAQGRIIAGARSESGGFADTEAILRSSDIQSPPVRARFADASSELRRNTTLAFVAVNAAFSKVQLQQLAAAATAAFQRRITPCGTSFDGDVVFAACPPHGVSAPLPVLEALAVAALEDAIERAVLTAHGRDGFPGLADLNPEPPAFGSRP